MKILICDERPIPAMKPLIDTAPRRGTWLPIDTAPRDGTFVLLAGPSGYSSTPLRVEVCAYFKDYEAPWRNHAHDAFEDGGCRPTLWIPLPLVS
jgi:hypothetical protein